MHGDAESPDWDSFHFHIFLQKRFCLIPLAGSQNGAMTKAAESITAQINSQSKLTLPRRKIRHKNEILKENYLAP
jgi:hypothetical protein